MQHYLVIALPQYDDIEVTEYMMPKDEIVDYLRFIDKMQAYAFGQITMAPGDVFCYRGGWIICTNNLIRS